MKLNNKGQTLITFILLIPIILLVLVMVVDIGMMGLQKRQGRSALKSSIAYALNHNSSDEEIKNMIMQNVYYDNIEIFHNDGITITINYHLKPVLGIIKGKQVKITYKGLKEKNKIYYEEG